MGARQSNITTAVVGAHTNGLKSLLDTGEHSDLLLRCSDGKEFKVHKAIVCAQSEFFRKACKPEKFKEGKLNLVELTIGNSTTIGLLLNFLYTMNYANDVKAKNCLLNNVNLYVAADFYAIEALKKVAAAAFEKHLTEGLWKTGSFPKALEVIYSETPSSDRKLRDVALAVLMEHAAELFKFDSSVPTELSEVIESLPELSKDIAIQSLSEVEKFKSAAVKKD
ncbi:hypothetical protein E2P81_ATG06738 [Venturia nashicola]|uniref:BTB domain-containing protein n=1 Tax=Venturia nashicola TaxID=86259 RepID=A0A4Z1PE39_9PEZI|nr:hypothetical protein E6O75_ATG06909 [Venturia nashicola]TLD30085.1 hypothetical protein E2P81_ATG06738 [Venturia nashicola]